MAKERFYLENDFKKYVERKLKSSEHYANYTHNIIELFKKNNISEIFNNLKECFESDMKRTLSFLINVKEVIIRCCKNPKFKFNRLKYNEGTLTDYNSGFSYYIKFLETKVINQKKTSRWNQKCEEEKTLVYNIAHRVDGTDSLLRLLNVHTSFEFAKLVLNESYLFDPLDVKKQFGIIKKQYGSNNNGKMFARWAECYLSQFPGKNKKEIIDESEKNDNVQFVVPENVKRKVTVQIDKDGNKAVRELIKQKTGHKVSQGKESTFQFYKISHIWGNASDPRYFTNLWNIVLVPAWANDLLDKTNSRDPLTVAFQQIIKYVCIKHYNMESLKWNLIDMNCPEFSKDYIDSLKNNQENNNVLKIQINVFSKKEKGAEFAKIRCVTIEI